MLDRIDLPQGTLDLLILRTRAQRHPGKSVRPHLLEHSLRQKRGCESDAGTAAPFFKRDDIGCLRAGAHSNQASGEAEDGCDDPGRSQCAAECTAGNWGTGLSLSA